MLLAAAVYGGGGGKQSTASCFSSPASVLAPRFSQPRRGTKLFILAADCARAGIGGFVIESLGPERDHDPIRVRAEADEDAAIREGNLLRATDRAIEHDGRWEQSKAAWRSP